MDSDTRATGVAVIADVVRSRSLPDRAAGQRRLEEALDRVNARVPAVQPMAPTVGDECQGMFASLADAVRATLLLRLELGDAVDCRFGIGRGWFAPLPSAAATPIQDGSAWWTARAAIDETKRRAARSSTLRSWFVPDAEAAGGSADRSPAALVNAYLLARDQLVGVMDARSRRLLLGRLDGVSQKQLAAEERITASAVSHSLRRNGALAIIDGAALLAEGAGEAEGVRA